MLDFIQWLQELCNELIKFQESGDKIEIDQAPIIPCNPLNVPILDWEEGSIDLRKRQACVELNNRCLKFYNDARDEGFEPRIKAWSRRMGEFNEPTLSVLHGRVVMLKRKSFEKFLQQFSSEPKDELALPPTETILSAINKEPKMTKEDIRLGYFENISIRRFNLFWAQAAEQKPEISKPGRKS